MLKKSVYIIGLFSLLAVVACSSGTVDPNANPLAYAYESSSSMSEQSISSSSIFNSLDLIDKIVEEWPKSAYIVKDEVTLIVVSVDGKASVDSLHSLIEFSTEATQQYGVAVGEKNGVVKSTNDAQVAVYGEEQGATATCDNSKEGIVGACDKDGNLEAYCSYVDESADFDTLLKEFTEEVEKICGEGHCQINKTN